MIEPGSSAELLIVFGIASRERDRSYFRLDRLCFCHEFEPITIRQAEVAQKNVDSHILQKFHRLTHATCRDDLMIRSSEKAGKHPARSLMVFNDEDVHGSVAVARQVLVSAARLSKNGLRPGFGCRVTNALEVAKFVNALLLAHYARLNFSNFFPGKGNPVSH